MADRTYPFALGEVATQDASPDEPTDVRPARQGVSALVRLFSHHERMDARAATEGLSPLTVDDLVRIGLLHREGTRVTARFGIERFGAVLVLHDWAEWWLDPGYVMGVTNAARSLAYLTPRRPVGTVLDLGTGSGIQAVLAAHHAERVVATDVSERALSLARATVDLNGLTNVELRQGSWFEPVDDDRFDLVVTNPPFVISPENRLVYRDGGQDADDLCGMILADVPAHLAPGGFSVMLVEWARRRGEEWWSTPSRWMEGLAADGLAVRYGVMDPRQYAVRWNQASAADPARMDRQVRAWVSYYEDLGLDQMYEGVIALQAPSREGRTPSHWVVGASRVLDGPGGDQLRAVLAGHVAIDHATPDGIFDAVPRLVDGHSLFQELRFEDGRYVMGQIRGGFDRGIGVDIAIAPDELPLVLSIDGVRPLVTIVTEMSPDQRLEDDRTLAVVTRLAHAGLLAFDRPSTP